MIWLFFLGTINTFAEVIPSFQGQEAVQTQVESKDLNVRSIGNVSISNSFGSMKVVGWPLDKIRVRLVKTYEKGGTDFSVVQLKTLEDKNGNLEIRTLLKEGLDIREKLKLRENLPVQTYLEVKAPSQLNLRLFTKKGSVELKRWRSTTQIRTRTGKVKVDDFSGRNLQVLCFSCPVHLSSIESSLKVSSGQGDIQLHGAHGKTLYLESSSGKMTLSSVIGEMTLVTQSGAIEGSGVNGKVEFATESGNVWLKKSRGFVSGHTDTGDIRAEMNEWTFVDRALIESLDGNISLTVPQSFRADIQLVSVFGQVQSEFSIDRRNEKMIGPMPANQIHGTIRRGKGQIKLVTQAGDIRLVKGY